MPRKSSSLRDNLFANAVLIVACVGFPAFVTWIAPVSWVRLTRHGDEVEARVKVCLFFVIPFRTDEVSAVTSVDHHVRAGVREKLDIGDSDNRRREITTESEGMLVLHGVGKEVVVQLSPASLDGVARKVGEFLEDKSKTELRFFTAANWKISVFVGGALCLLTLLYLLVLITSLFYRARP